MYPNAIAENGDIIVGGNHLFALDSEGNLKWSKRIGASAITITGNGTTALAYYDATTSMGHIGRININQITQYSGWNWNDTLSLQDTQGEIQNTDIQFEMAWIYSSASLSSSESNGEENGNKGSGGGFDGDLREKS